jgi:ribosomal protein S12 methylthiotransferase
MKFFIDQHGCAKNQVDGEEIASRLEDAGHEYVSTGEEADLIIVNTCGFIESAKKESIDAAISIKRYYPGKKLLLAGCLAQRYPEALLEDMVEADGIFGNADLSRAVESAERTMGGSREAMVEDQPDRIKGHYYGRTRLFGYRGSAHVKITEGCSNRCSFCAIPLIRGNLRSRSIEDVVEECRSLIASGIHEINLIGQDLGAYGRDLESQSAPDVGSSGPDPAGIDLPALLRKIALLPGDFRVRVLYIHPDHFPRELLEVMKEHPKILPYFDLPFQHASERLLKTMNRKGSRQKYLELVAGIRTSLPDAMIRSTFLVGFPGETEEDFAELRAFQDEAQLDWMGVFAYSREEGTAAWDMKGRVSRKTANERKKLIEAAQEAITPRRLERFIGRRVEILIEETVKDAGMSLGRAWMQAPDVDGLTVIKAELPPGSLAEATIVAVNGLDLEAESAGTPCPVEGR